MPPPLSPEGFKLETEKIQFSKIVPSDHGQSKKRGGTDNAKTSQHLPLGTQKKRSAFEDLTNASESQLVQSKKENNTEFVRNISKRMNMSIHSLGFAKNNEVKRYKVQPEHTASSTTSLLDTEKKLTVDIPAKSKIPTTQETSLFKKALILNEEPATEEKTLIKKTLKRKTSHGEMFLPETPLTLLEETENDDEFDLNPMTFRKKYKPEESAIIEGTLSTRKRYLYQEMEPHQKLLFIQDKNSENYFYLELTGFDEPESVTEEASVTSRPLSLNNKCTIQAEKHTTQGKSSELQKVTTREKSHSRKPFLQKNPITEKRSLSQEPSSLQEKYRTQGEISMLKKPEVLQRNTNNEDDTLNESVTCKRKHIAIKSTKTETPSYFKKKCNTQEKISHFQPVTHENWSFTNEPLSFKKSTTKKDSPFQGLSALQEMHTTQVEVSTVKKHLILQKHNTEEESQFQVASDFKNHCIMEEAPYIKKLLPLKKQQCPTQKRRFCYRPLVEEPITSERLSFKKSTIDKNSFSWGSSALQEKHILPRQVSTSKKCWAIQKHPTEEESHFHVTSGFKNWCIIDETTPTKKPLLLEKQQHTIQGTMSHLKNPLGSLTATSRAKSLIKESLPFKDDNMFLQKSNCTTHITPICSGQSEWQEIIDGDINFFSTKPGPLREEPTTGLMQGPSSLKETYSIPKKVSPSKLLASQEKPTSQEEAHIKEPVTLKEGPADYYEFSPELFSPYSSENEDNLKLHKSLDLQEKIDTKNDPSKKLLASQGSISEEEAFFRKFFCRKAWSSNEESSQEKIVAQEQEFLLKRELELHENSSSDGDIPFIRQSEAFQEYSSIEKKVFKEPLKTEEKLSTEKMALLKKPLILQGNSIGKAFLREHTSDTGAHFKKRLILQETPSIAKEATVQEPLTLLEKSRTEVVPVLKELLVLLEKPCMEKMVTPKEPFTSQTDVKSKAEALLKELLTLMEKALIEEDSTSREPLALWQESLTKTEVTSKNLKENPSTEKETSPKEFLTFHKKFPSQRLLGLEEKPTHEKKSLSEAFFFSQVKRKPSLSSHALEYRPGHSNAINMPHISKFNPAMKVCPHKSDLKNPPSSMDRILKEIGIVEDSDTLQDSDLEDPDPPYNSEYVKEIFSYLKEREEKFIVEKYMDRQIDITIEMRAILVDWMMEIQACFQMSHESLYLAVKLVDHYLMKVPCKKDYLQLIGCTAYMIAAKFEEPFAPSLSEFLYICEDHYRPHDMITMEVNILKTLNFDINIPTAYHFLRRFALSIHSSMKTLTLSRFICELTLLEYDYTREKPSKLAAASFLLALYMRNKKNGVPFMEYFSGYQATELHPLVWKLNMMLTLQPYKNLRNVYEKYSEEAFFSVNKIPPLKEEQLEEIMKM